MADTGTPTAPRLQRGPISWTPTTALQRGATVLWIFFISDLEVLASINISQVGSVKYNVLKVVIHLFKTEYFLMLILLLEILKGV